MAWMRVDAAARDHRKIRKLARALGVPLPTARGLVFGLWLRVLAEEPDGVLDGWTADDVHDAAGAEELAPLGPDVLAAALEDVGLLDRTPEGYAIHDWEDYSTSHHEASKRAERRAAQRAARALATAEDQGPQGNLGLYVPPVRGHDADSPRTVRGRAADAPRSYPGVSAGPDGEDQTERTGPTRRTIAPQEVVAIWNKTVEGTPLPSVRSLTTDRNKKIRTRIAKDPARAEAPWWVAYFGRIAASPFCRGEIPGKDWVAPIDWAIRSEDIVARVLEGHYDPRRAPHTQGPGGAQRVSHNAAVALDWAHSGED